VNNKIDGFGIRTGPIPPVFIEFQKIRPVFLTLAQVHGHDVLPFDWEMGLLLGFVAIGQGVFLALLEYNFHK
jgi:hypothetical protein